MKHNCNRLVTHNDLLFFLEHFVLLLKHLLVGNLRTISIGNVIFLNEIP